MPVPAIAGVLADGLDAVPGANMVLRILPWLAAAYVLKWYFSGSTNTSERNMHGKVVMITVSWPLIPSSLAFTLNSAHI